MKSLLALLLLCATPLQAQTYKWVDEKGVTNYSSAPPPSAAKSTAIVEERLSVVQSDPSLASAIAAMRARAARSADFAELEWLQRHRMMAAAQLPRATRDECAYYRAGCGYESGYFPYGYVPVVVRGVARSGSDFSGGRFHYTRIAGRPTYR